MNYYNRIEDSVHKLSLPRKFTLLSFGLLIGVMVSSANLEIPKNNFYIFITLFFSIFLVGFINIIIKNHLFALCAFTLLFFVSGFFWTKHFQDKNHFDWNYGQKAALTGRIINRPVLKETKQEVILEVRELNSEKISAKPKILVYLPRYPYLNYADRISVEGTIEKPGNFDDFNFENYLKKYPVAAYIKQVDESLVGTANYSWGEQMLSRLYNFCASVERLLSQILPEPQSSFAAGLILGQKTNLPEDLVNSLKITGTTHLIALSGYNVTIIVSILMFLLSPYFSRKRLLLTGLLLVSFFVIMTGMSPSVVRAAIFSILIIFGQTIGRRGDQTNLMLFAAVLMVAINPNLILYDIGFQLSFAAFIGLLYFSPTLESFFDRINRIKLPVYLKKILAETLGAQIAVLPVILTSFGTISLISPLANLAVLWLIPPAMIATLAVVLLGLIWLPLGKIAAVLIWPVLSYITNLINLVAKIPSASIQVNNTALASVIVSFLLLLFFYLLKTKKYEKTSR